MSETDRVKPGEREEFEKAARNMDWQQIVLNGGPPN